MDANIFIWIGDEKFEGKRIIAYRQRSFVKRWKKKIDDLWN